VGDARRTRELATIHCMKRDLKLDDDSYRNLLYGIAGVRSAGELTADQRTRVIQEMQRDLGPAAKKYPGRPHNMDSKNAAPELAKLEALLADGKLPWAYADGIAQQMFKVDRIAFCTSEQIRAVITALIMNAKRKEQQQ
jgi:phage gp16-like protein